ncbi:MAG: hypothetical protein HYR84_16715 [Planctomycetes bacterium]|nr:hypothetical protein [Planctomycetota bacterium]
MRFGLFLALGALSLFSVGANAQDKKHPHHHLHHALWELRDARKELKESKHDFGGHKEKALAAINDAIKQLDLVLLYKGDNIKGVPTRGDLKEEYKKYKHHPHLHHALHELKHAHHQLKEASHNFNGHRENALRDIHIAIQQVEILLKHHKK